MMAALFVAQGQEIACRDLEGSWNSPSRMENVAERRKRADEFQPNRHRVSHARLCALSRPDRPEPSRPPLWLVQAHTFPAGSALCGRHSFLHSRRRVGCRGDDTDVRRTVGTRVRP